MKLVTVSFAALDALQVPGTQTGKVVKVLSSVITDGALGNPYPGETCVFLTATPIVYIMEESFISKPTITFIQQNNQPQHYLLRVAPSFHNRSKL